MDGTETSWAGRDERVFTYLPVERELLGALPDGAHILDLGCGEGSHLSRLASGGWVVGIDPSMALLAQAVSMGPVVAGSGERLPFSDEAFDLVYVSHVLHHSADHRGVLSEVHRVLRPDGTLVLVETCEDSPLMRLARTLRPRWESVPVRSRFRYAGLVQAVRGAGFRIQRAEQFNVLYWIWGFARRKARFLERHVGKVVRLEMAAVRRLRRYSAYGFIIGRRE